VAGPSPARSRPRPDHQAGHDHPDRAAAGGDSQHCDRVLRYDMAEDTNELIDRMEELLTRRSPLS
jgi:hypothetical protein